MHNGIKKPKVAILGEFDSTPYTGNLYRRSGNAPYIELTNNTNNLPFFDLIGFLNGYGTETGKTLNDVLNDNKPAGMNTLTASFAYGYFGTTTRSARFMLTSNVTFNLASTGTNPEASREMFGFDGTETATGGNNSFTIVANKPWKRGVFQTNFDTVGGLKIGMPAGPQNVSTSFQYTSASGTMFNMNAATRLFPNGSTLTNGVTLSDFTINTTISAVTDSNATVVYKIVNTGTSGGNTYFDLTYSNGAPLDFTNDFSNNGFSANSTTFSATVLADTGAETVTDVVPTSRRVQNLIVWMRTRGSVADADDIYASNCLETLEANAETNGTATDMTCVLEEDGRVSFNFANGSSNSAYLFTGITAAGKKFLKRLGFDGDESIKPTTSGARQIKANNRAPCVLATNRGYVEMRRMVDGRDEFTIMADGSVVSSGLMPIRGWDLTIRLAGPAHGYDTDLERHLRQWWNHARRGLTIYPSFGDPDNPGKGGNDTRRHLDILDLEYGAPIENTSYTTEAEHSANHFGKRTGGRLLVHRHPSDSQRRNEKYSGQLDIHQDIQLRVLDDPTR